MARPGFWSYQCETGEHDMCDGIDCWCKCHAQLSLEPVRRTFDADELGIDQEDD